MFWKKKQEVTTTILPPHPLDLEHRKSEVQLKYSGADREIATAFQLKGQLLLRGLAEMRMALGSPQIDSEKEKENSNETKIALKGIFSEEEAQARLRSQYGKILDIYVRYVEQIDPAKLNVK